MIREMKWCKQVLAAIWFAGSALIGGVVIAQCIAGKYGDSVSEAIGWLLPTIMPTLSLMIAVFASEALTGGEGKRDVESFMFWLTAAISIFYLVLVSATVFGAPFARVGPLQLMKTSNLWLGPVQGLAAASLGVFFVNPHAKA